MKERELIRKIQKLRQIEPSKEWVLMTKKQILGEAEEVQPWSLFGLQLSQAFVFSLLIVILAGGMVIVVSQSKVPGDFLYSYSVSFRKISEALQRQKEDESELYLSLAEEKMQELKEMAKSEQKESLALAIQETAEAIKKAAESIPEASHNPSQTSKYVQKVNKIQSEKKEIEEVLGVALSDEEIEELENKVLACITKSIENTKGEMQLLVEREIKEQEASSLNESEKAALEEAKELYAKGEYSQALERLLRK